MLNLRPSFLRTDYANHLFVADSGRGICRPAFHAAAPSAAERIANRARPPTGPGLNKRSKMAALRLSVVLDRCV